MTPAQCRAARTLVGMSIKDLALAAVIPEVAIWNYERSAGALWSIDLEALQDTLERAGVEFINVGGQPGVILKKGEA
jgi:transcriptional regulator with XRE-family HTH domain